MNVFISSLIFTHPISYIMFGANFGANVGGMGGNVGANVDINLGGLGGLFGVQTGGQS